MPNKPKITIDSRLASESVQFSPFVIGKTRWSGTIYKATPGYTLRSLATADDAVLIGEQELGKSRVIWIGYNLVFHAFYYKNNKEKKLIQNIFQFAFMKSQ